jgi:putative DNA-invertase from lambdoid prophage Rac
MVAFPIVQGSLMSSMRAALSARVSPHDHPTLTMQIDALRAFATWRHWPVTDAVEESASGATDHRPKRQTLLKAAKPRQRDAMLAWKLDRWRRSLIDCTTTLHERTAFGVGYVSLTEALDLTTPAGRAFVGVLTVCAACEREVIRERITAGIADARPRGKAHGRPRVTVKDAAQMRALAQPGLHQAAMARPWDLWRTSVRRVLREQEGT